ncbi:hypothetical protein FA95DRAFT_1588895 [Auriscalpium vulgare]|uniref:Uncharacterized protein n=1 Tax=Auriscalpium vulgare TaxID=40419 RepID=A0ACB8RW71_9AGAM|nr:hypothetical protein FA95DRAFT_1588895 [Auriscalpium vulgare]
MDLDDNWDSVFQMAETSDDWDSIFQLVETRLTQDETVNSPPTPPLPARALSPAAPLSLPTVHRLSLVKGDPNSLFLDIDSSGEQQNTVVPISTAFFPGANLDGYPPDLLVLSCDGVLFYVHRGKLLAASDNYFASYVPYESNDEPVSVPLESEVLNILLHVIYGMPVAHYFPTADAVVAAIKSTRTYGLASDVHLAPRTPLYEVAVSVASSAPIRFYALAAALDAYPLAVAVSPRLLSFPLDSITDDVAAEIGAVYLKRLFFLHLGRMVALKRLLEMPLRAHRPLFLCDAREHKKLATAWSLASAYLVWNSTADVTSAAIEKTIRSLGTHLTCSQCSIILRDRTTDLVLEWSKIKDTI